MKLTPQTIRSEIRATEFDARTVASTKLHIFAMAAKEAVFMAQDQLHAVYGESGLLEKKLSRRLAKVRAELEQLDNDVLAYRSKMRQLGRQEGSGALLGAIRPAGERCTCGHIAGQHVNRFGACTSCSCQRWSWSPSTTTTTEVEP